MVDEINLISHIFFHIFVSLLASTMLKEMRKTNNNSSHNLPSHSQNLSHNLPSSSHSSTIIMSSHKEEEEKEEEDELICNEMLDERGGDGNLSSHLDDLSHNQPSHDDHLITISSLSHSLLQQICEEIVRDGGK